MHLGALNLLVLCVAVVLFAADHAAARPIDPTYFTKADEAINAAIDHHDIPGAVLVAGTDKQIVYAKAYGNRAIEPTELPAKLDTIYDMASCSKSIGCATSVMILVEQGKIDVHAPVAKYIPEFASHGKGDITVEDLLLHHSGLVADNPISDYADGPEKAWPKIFDTKPTDPPGTKFVYSDMNYIILGELVHRISGEPLDQFAHEHIFAPLGMTDTMYNPPEPFKDRCAYCEKRGDHWMVGEVHDPRSFALGGVAGHAGVFSTGADVAKWCQMILNGGVGNGGEGNGHRIMKESTLAEMTTMHCLPNHTGCRGYGFDFNTPYSPSVRGDRFAVGTTFGHTGYTGTSFWIDPVNRCFVVLLTNRVHPVDAKSKENLHLRRLVDTAVAEAFLGPMPTTQKASADFTLPTISGVQALACMSTDLLISNSPSTEPTSTYTPPVLCGIDVLERDHFQPLDNCNIALITNQTGLTYDGRRTIDVLHDAPNCKLIRLFSPEHGLYGKLDEKVGNTTDEKTGLPVFSLYGETRRPSDEMLAGIDTLVYDIQDVGARFYTYESTMGICMEEAAKHHLKFFVLDRPNPVTGLLCDGPIADKEHFGFTAYNAEPVAHGMTLGELAQLFNDAFNIHCDLHVIQMQGWKRSMWFDETGLMWTNPSPNMRTLNAALLYTGICLLEQTNVSVGRGTDDPFEQFGAPWIDAKRLAASLNTANLPGLRFVPIQFTPDKDAKLGGQLCQGVYVLVTDRNAARPVEAGITICWTLHQLFGDKFEVAKVEKILQNHQATEAIVNAKDPATIPQLWADSLNNFMQMRNKALMYQ